MVAPKRCETRRVPVPARLRNELAAFNVARTARISRSKEPPGNILSRGRPGESAAHRGGFFRNDGQQDARGAVGTAAALLPSMYRGHVQAECTREGALRQPQPMPELRH